MPNFSDNLSDDFVPRIIDLLRYSESERLQIYYLLHKLSEELRTKIEEADLEGARASSRVKRLDELKKQVDLTIASYFTQIKSASQETLKNMAIWSAEQATASINRVIGVELASAQITTETAHALASKVLIQGHPAASWWDKQSSDLKRNFLGQMRMGLALGETNNQLVQRIRGTSTGKFINAVVDGSAVRVREFQGGIIQTTTREATALVRTAAMAVSAAANEEAFKQDEDLFTGYYAVVTLDLRTTLLCISRSGGAWDLKGNPLPQSTIKIKFPGRPPWHWNCRTVILPLLKTWKQLMEDQGLKGVDLLELPVSTRASMDGQVPANWTYQDWLSRQTEVRQDKVLGPARAALFRSGKLPLSRLVDPTGRELTLEQLRAN